MFEIVGSSVEFDNILGMQVLGLRKGGLSRSSRAFKRGMDLFGSAVGLLLLAPILLAIAVAVKLSSSGPVLFKQPRIGRHGKRFQMAKFRTMVQGADDLKDELRALNEADGLFKISNDPRVTPVGRFLRRSSLDELPQLLHVLSGQMSLVGPRPLVPDEDEQIQGWYRARLEISPGMTGFWQISGSSRVPMHEMVKIDYLYRANWSLWVDVKILLRTVTYALGQRGL